MKKEEQNLFTQKPTHDFFPQCQKAKRLFNES